ncbi:D-alanyl-D-alanine carboxypeptidase/D-alanyl-D-alanine endopeptidase [Bacillus tuaregi]|uniref:D-alanyl-D-alanine carboxypeptidase/D-alanyl-D-alanine endopeptidase n=1 Tax=Bacillus tuaregi TaxID=1816695 RepID=UPI0008F8C9BE|nr:D-alanyl-D-alanine carboxypeptidase/D-alanyl-D-alanine-endopeptidase [Bacillus tuaregi]
MNRNIWLKGIWVKGYIIIALILLSLTMHNADSAQAADPFLPVAAEIDELVKDSRLKGSITGISIRKAESGEIVYSKNGDIRLHPASNMKLLTAAAALERLGADYQFSTELWTNGRVRGTILDGNLYLKGKGDPTLMKEDLDHFAEALRAKGITQIKGNLIADDSWYDSIRLSQDLNWSDEAFHTGAQVSALTLSPNQDYDAGTVLLEITPGDKNGNLGSIQVTPKNKYVTIINKTKTVADKEISRVTFERIHGTNTIMVEGTISKNSKPIKKWAAVWEPTEFVLEIFKDSLEENGITFTGKALLGVTPKKAERLALKRSIPLKQLLIPFMKLSNNGHAEMLTKEMGKMVYDNGSWESGLQVIEETLAEWGLNEKTIQIRDGSGMSHKNMIPANELSQLLYTVQRKSWFPEFEKCLPLAGHPDKLIGGTLRNRLKAEPTNGKVRAKTGSISGVSTLSGYMTAKSGQRYIFSIMMNNVLAPSVTDMEDQIVRALAEG